MELLAFGHAGAKVLVFPTREGRFFDYENWGLVDAVRKPLEDGRLRLYCVDGVDSESLYCRTAPPPARVERHRQFEAYVLNEVIPLMKAENGMPTLVAHGCSIGAYHAVTLALRHPGLFHKVVGLSGRYDLTRPVGPFEDLFSGHYDQDVYFITPNHFVPNLEDAGLLTALRNTEITLAVGAEDPFHESNRRLSEALAVKGVGHQFAVWPGEAHRARFWREMVPQYL